MPRRIANMIELLATIIITVSSMALFGYWFRSTCLLILSTKTARDYAGEVAAANQLGFLEVRSQLQASSPNLVRLRDVLDRDYAVLSSLLKQAGSLEHSALEKRMLEMNYRFLRSWYQVSHRFSPAAAARALDEMSQVIAHFANVMGQSAACSTAA